MLKNGVTLVKFENMNGRDEVIEGGVFHFDKKPVVVKAWTPNLDSAKSKINSVPVWVKLHGLDIKYWSASGLSTIGSLIGVTIMGDMNTQKKTCINFARILVEVQIKHKLKDVVYFQNEKGIVLEQEIDYEWKHVQCRGCNRYGSEEGDCRKKCMYQSIRSLHLNLNLRQNL